MMKVPWVLVVKSLYGLSIVVALVLFFKVRMILD